MVMMQVLLFCVHVFILPLYIKCLTEQERVDEWIRRGNVWPPQWQPGLFS